MSDACRSVGLGICGAIVYVPVMMSFVIFFLLIDNALSRSTTAWFYGLRRFEDSKRMHKKVIK